MLGQLEYSNSKLAFRPRRDPSRPGKIKRMRITSIITAKTDLEIGDIALRTDPSLTEEIFALAARNFGPSRDLFSFKEGLLHIARKTLSEKDVEDIAEVLSEAEKTVNQEQAATETKRKTALNYLSTESGLTLE